MVPTLAYFPIRAPGNTLRLRNAITTHPLRYCRNRMVAAYQRGISQAPEKEVVLLSGGVESSTLLYDVHRRHGQTLGLFFRYGQRAVVQEEAAARAQCEHLGIDDFIAADLTGFGECLRGRQKERLHVPLPHRNLVLLSLGVSVAAQEGGRVWIAVCKDDMSWYASASGEFLQHFKNCARTLGVGVETPLLELRKAEVVRKGLELGVRFEDTWSCMIGRGRTCGRCVQCRARKKAFLECGLGFT